MAYVTSVQRIGEKLGRAKGRVEGRVEGLKSTLNEILQMRLGEIPAWIAKKVNAADEQQLRRWTVNLALQEDLDEVFQT